MIAPFGALLVLGYFSQGYLYFYNVGMIGIEPVHWYVAALCVGTLILAVRGGFIDLASMRLDVLAWVAAFLLLMGMSFILFGDRSSESVATLVSRTEAMLLFLLFVVVFQDERSYRFARVAILAVVLMGVFLNCIEFLSGGAVQFSDVSGRAAGLYENANLSGQLLVFGMVLSATLLPRKLRWIYCVAVAAGVVVTFSRSSIILWALAMLAMGWYNWLSLPRVPSVAVMSISLALLGGTLASGDLIRVFESAGANQLLTKNTESRMGSAFQDQTDYSSQARRRLAWSTLDLFVDAPLVGQGIGATRESPGGAPHNQYLQEAAEFGIGGLILLLTLVWLLWRTDSDVGPIAAIQYAVSCLFTHNNFDYPAVQIAVALALCSPPVLREIDTRMRR